MAHAEICPICHGRGKIKNPMDITAPVEITCHGCGGKGWIEVSDETPVFNPWPWPYVPSYQPWPYSSPPPPGHYRWY